MGESAIIDKTKRKKNKHNKIKKREISDKPVPPPHHWLPALYRSSLSSDTACQQNGAIVSI
jgi:hypothetical protein